MTQVLIVGGGPTGLFLAAELALAGVRVTVAERAAERPPHSKALGVHARTLETLAMRGAEKPFLDRGTRVPSWHYGMLESRLDLTALDTPYPFLLAIPQAVTEALLEERARDLGVDVRRGAEVVGLTQNGDGVTVELAGGETVHSLYAVGADGTRSVVRDLAGIPFEGTEATEYGLVADVELASPPPPGFARVTAQGSLIVAPVPGGRFRLGGYDPYGPDRALTLEDLRAFLHRVAGTDFGLGEADWLSRFGNATKVARSYRSGRVLLAGDAAHMHFPTGGVGLNLGVQDAMNLGWKLAAVLGGASPDLLDTYEAERRPVGQQVAADTQAQTVLLTGIHPEGLALRAVFNRLLAGHPEVNREFAERVTALSVAYPAPDGAHPLTGTRAPAVPELFDRLSAGRPVLLNRTGVSPSDRMAALRFSFGDGAEAAIVRPDGYVWWATDRTSADLELAAIETFPFSEAAGRG